MAAALQGHGHPGISFAQSSGPLRWGLKVDKVVLAPLRHVYCAPYQGYVGSDGMPVVGGDGEHGNGLAKQVLLELDALVAGYEQVIVALDGVPDQVPVPQGFPAQVLGGLDVVVRQCMSQSVGRVVVQQDLQ